MSDFIQAYTELAKAVEDEIAQRRERPAPPALSDGAGDDGPRCGAGGCRCAGRLAAGASADSDRKSVV